MKELIITNDNFQDEVLNSKLPVMLDFSAIWCGPCQMIAPVIEKIAKEYKGKVKVGNIDVDESPELAGRFNVASIPTIIVIKEGKVIDRRVGYCTKEELVKMLDI